MTKHQPTPVSEAAQPPGETPVAQLPEAAQFPQVAPFPQAQMPLATQFTQAVEVSRTSHLTSTPVRWLLPSQLLPTLCLLTQGRPARGGPASGRPAPRP